MNHVMPIARRARTSELMAGRLLAGRCCLAAVFVYSGTTKLAFSSAGLREFAALGLPLPALLLAAAIIVQVGAGLGLMAGWYSRTCALLLAAFTGLATLIGHPFWLFEGSEFHRQLTTALEHLAMIGGLVVIAAVGPGPISFETQEDRP